MFLAKNNKVIEFCLRNRFLSGVSVLLVVASFFVSSSSANAAIFSTQLNERATHPNASGQSSVEGKKIGSLKLFDGKLYSGYGDYNANTGPIQINPFNPQTNTFEGSALSVPSEAIGNWRVLNGKLYTTTVDPTCGQICPAGYAEFSTQAGWQLKTPISAQHVYDIASLGENDLWLFTGIMSGAAVFHSSDNGSTWQSVRTSPEDRYYWGSVLNGNVYTQARTSIISSPLEVFNGTQWNQRSLGWVCDLGTVQAGPAPVIFKEKIICGDYSRIMSFDGTTLAEVNTTGINLSGCSLTNMDYTASEDFFYTLCLDTDYNDSINNARLFRTRDFTTWDQIDGLPENATSFEIDEEAEMVYAGTADSKIYSGILPAEDIISPEVTFISPQPGTEFSLTDEINVEAEITDNNVIRDVVFEFDGVVFRTKTSEPYSAKYVNYYTSSTGLWRAGPGAHVIKITATDTSGNKTVKTTTVQVKPQSTAVLTKTMNAMAPNGDTLNNKIILSVETGATISCSSVTTEKQLAARDLMYDYPYGLVDYCLTVPNGSTQTITVLYETSAKASQAKVRKYDSRVKNYSSVPQSSIDAVTIENTKYLRVSYAITDGGALDEDGIANGIIVDPVGLGFNPVVSAMLVKQSVLGGKGLARTGMNIAVVATSGISIVGVSIFVLNRLKIQSS